MTITTVTKVATVSAVLAVAAGLAASNANAAEVVNIPQISTNSYQQAERSGGAIITTIRRDTWPNGFTTEAPPTSVESSTTRLVSTGGATYFSREVRAGSPVGTGQNFTSLRLLEAQGVKGGAASLTNTPGPWLTANLARAAVRGTQQARLIPNRLPDTTSITGVTGRLAGAASSIAGTGGSFPVIEEVRASYKVTPEFEPADGLVNAGPAGSPERGFLAGTTQYQWSKSSLTLLNGDQCRDGEFFLVVNDKGLMTALSGSMTCADSTSKSGAEYRYTVEKLVSSYQVRNADVPGTTTPSVTWASLRR